MQFVNDPYMHMLKKMDKVKTSLAPTCSFKET